MRRKKTNTVSTYRLKNGEILSITLDEECRFVTTFCGLDFKESSIEKLRVKIKEKEEEYLSMKYFSVIKIYYLPTFRDDYGLHFSAKREIMAVDKDGRYYLCIEDNDMFYLSEGERDAIYENPDANHVGLGRTSDINGFPHIPRGGNNKTVLYTSILWKTCKELERRLIELKTKIQEIVLDDDKLAQLQADFAKISGNFNVLTEGGE